MEAREESVHPQKQWTTKAIGSTGMEGQVTPRSDAHGVVGLLRATVLRSIARIPNRARLPYGVTEHHVLMAWNQVVHRGRHQRMLRPNQSWETSRNRGAEDQRPTATEAVAGDARSGLHGGLEILPELLRNTTGWHP